MRLRLREYEVYLISLGNKVEASLKGGAYVVVSWSGDDTGVAYRVDVSTV